METRAEYSIPVGWEQVIAELSRYMTAGQVMELCELLRNIRNGSGYGRVTLIIDGRVGYIEMTERIPMTGRLPDIK